MLTAILGELRKSSCVVIVEGAGEGEGGLVCACGAAMIRPSGLHPCMLSDDEAFLVLKLLVHAALSY
jgi:hypothetical protein